MSKKHGKRRKHPRRKTPPAICRHCHAPKDTTPGAHLQALAGVLNSAASEGLRVKFAHGAVLADPHGYVLFVDGRWQPRVVNCPPELWGPERDELID